MDIKRRQFLKTASLASLGSLSWGVFPRLAKAADSQHKLLLVNLNGGLDGLATLQPSSGTLYATLQAYRPTLCLPPQNLLSANAQYGFNPNIPAFKSLYDEGSLLALLGVGYDNMTRSHLDAEVAFARGVSDRLAPVASGFLSRLGSANNWSSLRAVSVSGTDLTFDGTDYRGMQVKGLEDFYFKDISSYTERPHLVGTTYSFSLDGIEDANKINQKNYNQNYRVAVDSTALIQAAVSSFSSANAYPTTQFGKAFRDIDILFSSPEVNTQVGYLRAGGFDTHSKQKTTLDRLMMELDAALNSFIANMKSKNMWSTLTILVFSEFGRTNRENGSAGTDHGGANAVYLLGGSVAGGNILGDLTVSDLSDHGWLPKRINISEVYRQLVIRLGLDPDLVIPASSQGLIPGSVFKS